MISFMSGARSVCSLKIERLQALVLRADFIDIVY